MVEHPVSIVFIPNSLVCREGSGGEGGGVVMGGWPEHPICLAFILSSTPFVSVKIPFFYSKNIPPLH